MMTMSSSFLRRRQQVPQCVRPYQGPFLVGRLLLWLLSSRHGVGSGSDDDDDRRRRRRRRGGSAHQLATGGTEDRAARCGPFYLRRRRFSRRTKEPTPLMMDGTALNSSSARGLASSPGKPSSISKAFLPCWLTVRHRRALRGPHVWTSAASDEAAGSCSHWGCRRRTLKGWWSGPCRRRLPPVWRPWAVPWPGCIWHPRAYGGCKGSRPGDGGGHGVARLWPRPWWRQCSADPRLWPATMMASRAPATDSCCTVPCCHGEGVRANEAGSTRQSLCPSQQQQWVTASRWGRGGGLPPPSPLLRPERRVHRRMPPESPHQETGCCTIEISRVLTGWRGIAIGNCQQAITARVYLLVQVGDLGHVPGVLEQDDVSSIQADGPVAGVFVKNILDQMNDRWVIMMGPAREPRTHQVGVGCLHVIDDDQSSGLHGQLLGEVLGLIQQLYRARSLPGQFPVSRLHMTVKDQDTSGCPGHDPRGQCH